MLTHFCFCKNLRSGCIVFAWLQLMLNAVIITLMASPLAIFGGEFSHFHYVFYVTFHPVLSLGITEQVIKSLTCLALIWGIVKKNHVYFQPWLFILGVENSILSLLFIGLFIAGFYGSYIFFICQFICGIICALSWYLWACVYALYKRTEKTSRLDEDRQYESLPLSTTTSS